MAGSVTKEQSRVQGGDHRDPALARQHERVGPYRHRGRSL